MDKRVCVGMFLNALIVYNIVPFNHLPLSVNLREEREMGYMYKRNTQSEAPITAIISHLSLYKVRASKRNCP